ncbi:MAG: 2-oxo acid dehydrogenase subunit E2 [Lachnospiraceae bacterium]|nr:2-oxo acid dehydrogenase subunit E2 [Lachnospiraceae bacterium]
MLRRWGDRRDGKLIRDIDAMHYFMPLMYPNRCDNEAFMTMRINLEKTEEYLQKRAQEHPGEKMTIFQIVLAATLKTIWLRPQMNRFIANKNVYQRNDVTVAFVVKKTFTDEGEETLARIEAQEGDTLETIAQRIREQIEFCKTGTDESTKAMNFLKKVPGKHAIGRMARFLDRHGWMPQSVIATDPYQCSVVLSNLGSIGLNVGYHHLMNWGTTSVFIVIGKKRKKPHYDANGNVTMQKELMLSITIDERISDGFYYAKTMKLMKKLVENPELLELPIEQEV